MFLTDIGEHCAQNIGTSADTVWQRIKHEREQTAIQFVRFMHRRVEGHGADVDEYLYRTFIWVFVQYMKLYGVELE